MKRIRCLSLLAALDPSLAYAATDPASADTDADGPDDPAEVGGWTDPRNADNDGDGRLDGWEVWADGTDPTDATSEPSDADGDYLLDEDEAAFGTDPYVADADGDMALDGQQVLRHGTDPLVADTDGDGLTDGVELYVYAGYFDPLDASEKEGGRCDESLARGTCWVRGTNASPPNRTENTMKTRTNLKAGALEERRQIASDLVKVL